MRHFAFFLSIAIFVAIVGWFNAAGADLAFLVLVLLAMVSVGTLGLELLDLDND